MQNHYIIHKTILRSSHSFVEYGTPTSLMTPLEGSWRLSRLRGGFFIFSIATSPSLRDTSPQGEALPRPHTSHPYWTAHRRPLRLPLPTHISSVLDGTPMSLKAPLEGSWRLSRLRGGFLFSRLPPLRHSVTPLFRRCDHRSHVIPYTFHSGDQ